MNIRIAVPYLVEFIHNATGARVVRLYKIVDLVGMWFGLIIFFKFLYTRFTARESALACFYFAATLPLTFAFHSFHPYDRAGFVTWLMAIWCARAKHFLEFSVVSVIGVLIKYDAIVLPILYFLGNSTTQNWRKCLIQSSAMEIVLLAIFGALIGITKAAGAREFGGGFQGGTISGFPGGTAHGMTSSVDFNGPRLQDVRAETEPTR